MNLLKWQQVRPDLMKDKATWSTATLFEHQFLLPELKPQSLAAGSLLGQDLPLHHQLPHSSLEALGVQPSDFQFFLEDHCFLKPQMIICSSFSLQTKNDQLAREIKLHLTNLKMTFFRRALNAFWSHSNTAIK